MSGTLYLVSTPIGNLGDLSARTAETLGRVDFIAAEDTRVSKKLLSHLGIGKQLVSYFEHNKSESGEKILARLLGGESCALVTDAGTPAVSDPGEELVRLCAGAGIEVLVVPGPCAAVAALSLSGLPTGRFTFEGFLSTAKKSRFQHLDELKNEHRTMVFYEAPHKLLPTLRDMLSAFGDRRVAISRELTKIHEETLRFSLSEALAHFEQVTPRGEFVLVIEGKKPEQTVGPTLNEALESVDRLQNAGFSLKDAVRKSAYETGFPKNALYEAAVKRQNT